MLRLFCVVFLSLSSYLVVFYSFFQNLFLFIYYFLPTKYHSLSFIHHHISLLFLTFIILILLSCNIPSVFPSCYPSYLPYFFYITPFLISFHWFTFTFFSKSFLQLIPMHLLPCFLYTFLHLFIPSLSVIYAQSLQLSLSIPSILSNHLYFHHSCIFPSFLHHLPSTIPHPSILISFIPVSYLSFYNLHDFPSTIPLYLFLFPSFLHLLSYYIIFLPPFLSV